MNKEMEVIEAAGLAPRSRQQSAAQQIQIRQCEDGIASYGVFRPAAVAHPGKSPRVLNDMKHMLNSGARRGTTAVEEPIVLAQRSATRG
jgi:hypothetical protein